MAVEIVESLWSRSLTPDSYLTELRRFCLSDAAASIQCDTLSLLPTFFCRAFGGDERQVKPLLAVWGLLRQAAHILDDIVDNGLETQEESWPVALNASTGLLATAATVLNGLENFDVAFETATAVRHAFFNGILQTAGGQHLSLVNQEPTLVECWQTVETKTANPAGLVCWAGARLATDNERLLDSCYHFGFHFGVLDQIRDDLTDLWSRDKKTNDLTFARSWTLPIAFAMSVLPESDKYQLAFDLTRAASSRTAEKAARRRVVESGAGLYLMTQYALHHGQAKERIEQMNLSSSHKGEAFSLLGEIYQPTVA